MAIIRVIVGDDALQRLKLRGQQRRLAIQIDEQPAVPDLMRELRQAAGRIKDVRAFHQGR